MYFNTLRFLRSGGPRADLRSLRFADLPLFLHSSISIQEAIQASKVIVSCTTMSHRLHMLLPMLQSLQEQSLKPDRVLVNLSGEPYLWDKGFHEVPDSIAQAGATVNWVENTGPYRKLLPALEFAADDDVIVTVDDDVVYKSGWLEALMTLASRNPDDVVCARARG